MVLGTLITGKELACSCTNTEYTLDWVFFLTFFRKAAVGIRCHLRVISFLQVLKSLPIYPFISHKSYTNRVQKSEATL